MLFSVIICRIWSFATAINKLLFDKNCHICNSYQKGAIFYQSHKVFYTTVLFIIKPYDSFKVIAVIAGIMILCSGIFDLFYDLKFRLNTYFMQGLLFEGILKCILGIFIITH